MATVEALASASAKLHNFPSLSDAEYDCQIRDLVANCRNLLSTKALGSVSHDESTLDVSNLSLRQCPFEIVNGFVHRISIQGGTRLSISFFSVYEFKPSKNHPVGRCHMIYYPGEGYGRKLCAIWKASIRCKSGMLVMNFASLLKLLGRPQRLCQRHGSTSLLSFPSSTDLQQPLLATRPIREAILRLDPSCAVFTSTHLLFIQLCLKARSYACALPVLDKHVCHFPALSSRASSNLSSSLCTRNETSLTFITDSSGLSSKLTYKDYLRYFLYGGMVYMALKKWRKALHLLGVVISMPTAGSISMVMVEAYKKWVLVGLLAKGKVRKTQCIFTSFSY